MEQIVMIEQYKADLVSVVAQSRSLGKEIAITHNGEVLAYITPKIEIPTVKIKNRNAGFLKNVAGNTPAPPNFDRMFEDEIFALFSGEYDENIG